MVAVPYEFTGPEAAELAEVTYRQLDHWARRGWVVPSRVAVSPEGVQRRLYAPADVVRLAALGHLGRCRIDIGRYGEATGQLEIPDEPGFLIVWGTHDRTVSLTRARDLRRVASMPGRYVIFDPTVLMAALQRHHAENGGPRPRRRSFTTEYKLAMLAEYEGLTEPGAKTAVLRREGLHASHIVLWRRARDAGLLAAAPDGQSGHGGAAGRRPDATASNGNAGASQGAARLADAATSELVHRHDGVGGARRGTRMVP